MSFLGRVRTALSGTTASRVLSSPWADSSHLQEVLFNDIYGIDVEGPVTRAAAVRLATVAKGRDVLTGMISRQPLIAAKAGSPVIDQPTFFAQIERGCALVNTLTWTVDSMFFHGRAWWHITEVNSLGFPLWAEWVPEDQAETNDAGQLVKAFGLPVQAGRGIRFDGPNEGLLWRGADTIRRSIRLNRAAAKAENNPVPSIDLHNEGENLSAPEIKLLTSSWETARTTSGVGYSSKGLKVNVLGQPAEQLMIDGRKAINLELARHMGAPEWAVGVAMEGSSLSYSNRQSRNGELIDQFLSPYMAAITGRLSLDDITPHGTKVSFDSSELTREDTATRYANLKAGLDMKLFDLEHAQESEGLDPIGPNE